MLRGKTKVSVRWFVLSAALLAVVSAAIISRPVAAQSKGAAKGNGLQHVMDVQQRNTERLLAIRGVVGTGTGVSDAGNFVIRVYTVDGGVRGVPGQIEGVACVVKATGQLFALDKPEGTPGGGNKNKDNNNVDPTSRFDRPVPIGVSTGNEGECSAGTIACRVKSGADVFALSNNHVYARENLAPLGSYVHQPGLYDNNCVADPGNRLGMLANYVPIVFSTSANNTVDAAIAMTTTSELGNATPSNGYGLPKSAIVAAAVNQDVMKFGRTTSLTRGRVDGINAILNIGYSRGTARFVNQIVVETREGKGRFKTGPFIKPGDSGSLLVLDPDRNPVGLLYAGNNTGTIAIANEISRVLGAFGVQIDGE